MVLLWLLNSLGYSGSNSATGILACAPTVLFVVLPPVHSDQNRREWLGAMILMAEVKKVMKFHWVAHGKGSYLWIHPKAVTLFQLKTYNYTLKMNTLLLDWLMLVATILTNVVSFNL